MDEIIKVEDLEYTYPDGTTALRGIRFKVGVGESVGIIGPNGAGKTTLLLHLNGILQGKGKVKVLGLELNSKNLDYIRSKVGVVFQNPEEQLFMPTVFDDVAFGPFNLNLDKDEINSRVKNSLEEVGALNLAQRLTHHLSFGEKKKISIATALSMRPEILVLDEPSSNLDPQSRQELISLLKDLKITKLIATHDLKLIAKVCRRTVILYQGKIVIDSATETILKDKTLLKSYGLDLDV